MIKLSLGGSSKLDMSVGPLATHSPLNSSYFTMDADVLGDFTCVLVVFTRNFSPWLVFVLLGSYI